jgi:hypothetical protein
MLVSHVFVYINICHVPCLDCTQSLVVRVGPPPTNLKVRGFGELTISMAKCKALALVTLAKMKE